ncbi:AMP-binding protein [Aeromicrobium piscarium]|uniref:ATP-dependent acyl-CoA ligase n=1 Tax=Aeromicrobium piscarium TaxID=2590901 RepID=A0A554SFK7_9ACTN|nr:AMP-binding protein [Aeromicrobium piscarium]TSD65134.1 ATP-dependent acyl-CoA ligase [Aeromicrobium piscarium]
MNQEAVAVRPEWGPRSQWNLLAQLDQRLRERPEEIFLEIRGGRRLSFREAGERATAIAEQLAGLGVGPGDHVASLCETSMESALTYVAAKVGCLVDVPLNPAYRGRSLVHAINLSRAEVMFVDAELLDRVGNIADDLPGLRQLVVIGRSEAAVTRLPSVPITEASAPWSFGVTVLDRDLSSVLLTSGTTGPAKGVMMSHAHTYTVARECLHGLRMTADDVLYCCHPLFHMAGRLGAIFAAAICGARVVLDTKFDPAVWTDRIREAAATLTIAHGPMIEAVFGQPAREDDARIPLRAVLSAPLPAAIAEAFERRFDLRGVETWGMTEASVPVWRPYDAPLRPGASGLPLDDLFEVTIVDPETDLPVRDGAVGEITVRPKVPWVMMLGYLGQPDKTLEAWRNLRFHTGDAGYIDDQGWLRFVDRLGDRIRRKAENISSYDIEVAASSHPAVVECVAIGVSSEDDSEDEIKLCVVLDPGVPLEFSALFEHLVRELPHHMVPRYYEAFDELPKTPTSKVRRAELRKAGRSPGTWDYRSDGLSIRRTAEGRTAEPEGRR